MDRSRIIGVRLTDPEYTKLEESAGEMDMTISQYLRWKLELARSSRMRFKMMPVLIPEESSPNG